MAKVSTAVLTLANLQWPSIGGRTLCESAKTCSDSNAMCRFPAQNRRQLKSVPIGQRVWLPLRLPHHSFRSKSSKVRTRVRIKLSESHQIPNYRRVLPKGSTFSEFTRHQFVRTACRSVSFFLSPRSLSLPGHGDVGSEKPARHTVPRYVTKHILEPRSPYSVSTWSL